ncbi:SDR family NAD(P)-dependent oxidoreductase [Luteimonas aquatica]|uniref:SDR family NAD(P)-dependent oxidoreductase n=1 Tax=Luteimonas aquatica TaxID=450364 RepID=UPI001F5937B9|nr:SDR family oxidoreductase [Luteimonas aquatica]
MSPVLKRPILIVLGATGCVGRSVVAAALEAGHGVAAVARDPADLQDLRRKHAGADLVTIAASVGTDREAATLSDRIRDLERPIGGVIVAIRGDVGTEVKAAGRLLDQPADFLRRRLDEDLLPHLFAARHLLPLLAESRRGGYVLIGGPGAEQPWAGYGHRSIGNAALRMLARVLHDEARTVGVRVQLLAVDSPARTDANLRHACEQWPSVHAIARHAVAMTGGVEPPDHAIVRHGARSAPSDLRSDDLDARQASRPTACVSKAAIASDQTAPEQTAPAHVAPAAPRSSVDVRALLRAIASSPRSQETPSP